MFRPASFLSLHDFEPAAKKRLPRQLYGYLRHGAEDGMAIEANRQAFAGIHLCPKVLTDVSNRSSSISLLGQTYSAPFGLAPVGLAAMWCYRADKVLAQAAQEHNVPAIMSGASLVPMEEVAQAAPQTWFQAYLPAEQERIQALLTRVRNAGFSTLVLTVDLPVSPNPEAYARHGFSAPLKPSLRMAWDGLSHPSWLMSTFLKTLFRHGMPHFENWRAERGAPIISARVERDTQGRDKVSWPHVALARRLWQGPLIIKGILRPDDALLAAKTGCDGIIVSNHGGRQIDGAVSGLDMLPEIVAAVPNLPVMLDGGIRRGTDILKALSLGARCVFVGRPMHYAATVGQRAGVEHAIQILKTELHRNTALLGLNHPQEIDQNFVRSH
ncbi:alpha-hydroxy acid oxidase [Bordetella holmesii]|uniref:Dehydrogenase, FMN-dependent n=3 Tax=Bordetella holmesii TaxID=35814 RepID=A0A158M6A1_9BORD|nr:alpha-hydroxy acid oxidase [Bordetella holmesii]AHV94028.1 nitronate monooxygenase family protein [Bordetella holmesii ATCC 51541]AIT28381.1 nitronate monooxygenase family protein [Bordetella holmesii 44057]EWM43994.1 nitronate monooxygenase family protein [Bordetella holmesii 41130]EWM45061.1 nitronate monooxygenase family protein [Bordetella holmesii 70147]AMD47046.1 2-hydroxy-acid oxidase [Bordetella holmesii H558]